MVTYYLLPTQKGPYMFFLDNYFYTSQKITIYNILINANLLFKRNHYTLIFRARNVQTCKIIFYY